VPIGIGSGVARETDHVVVVRTVVEARIAECMSRARVGERHQEEHTSEYDEQERDDSAARWTETSVTVARRRRNSPKSMTGWR